MSTIMSTMSTSFMANNRNIALMGGIADRMGHSQSLNLSV